MTNLAAREKSTLKALHAAIVDADKYAGDPNWRAHHACAQEEAERLRSDWMRVRAEIATHGTLSARIARHTRRQAPVIRLFVVVAVFAVWPFTSPGA